MDWVLDPVDDVELVRDIERVRSVGTVEEKKKRKRKNMHVSFAHATIASPCLDHNLYFNIKRDKFRH